MTFINLHLETAEEREYMEMLRYEGKLDKGDVYVKPDEEPKSGHDESNCPGEHEFE
jgi:hypothetical protein